MRREPALPPPGAIERRRAERITLELAGLCLGLIEGPREGSIVQRLPPVAALLELARHPSVIAHEVANPLTGALASVELALGVVRDAPDRDPALRAELVDELSAVSRGIERAVAYLRSIQDQARGAHARGERFDAVKVAQSCVTLERPFAAKRGVKLEWEPAVDSVYLQGDPNGLYQILTNLIRNAVDASREGGRPIVLTLERLPTAVRFTMRDEGTGIRPEHLEHIFEPGFTTKEFGTGSGMGLAVVRDVTRSMFDGVVEVRSAPGRGSTFAVTLPLPPQRG